MAVKIPRLVIAGLSGDSGKTVVTLAVLNALGNQGMSIAPFKKGPDYIDAAWLTAVSNNQCRNLDSFMMNRETVREHFVMTAKRSDIAIIEGNRGVYDGFDATGKYSTAELAKSLSAPLILIVNVSKRTRTIAALINGIIGFDKELQVAGIVLNRVAGKRHEKVIRESIEKYCHVPVVGSIPKLGSDDSIIPGRHLGLITPAEFKSNAGFLRRLDEIAENYLDIDKLIKIANEATDIEVDAREALPVSDKRVNIGFFNDSIFTFYYPENLEELDRLGANLIPISSIDEERLPNDLDALYIGGGFPETQADKLMKNESMMRSVKNAAVNGLPIYAECGGLIYLSNSICWQDKKYPMAGLFPFDLKMHKKPIGHGYSVLQVTKENPFFEIGTEFKGHEFHYSAPEPIDARADLCMDMSKGTGFQTASDGIVINNCMALYTHLHALGSPEWAPALIRKAEEYKSGTIDRTEGKPENFSVTV